MNILFFIHTMHAGGAERVLSILANEFAKRGDRVRLVMLESCSDSAYKLATDVDVVHLVKDLPIDKKKNIFTKIRRWIIRNKLINKYEKEFKADVVISFSLNCNIVTLFANLFNKMPIVVSEHTNVRRKQPLKYCILRRVLYHRANAITVLTNRDYNLWKNRYKRLYHMPNPIELKRNEDRSVQRKNVILSVARVTDWYVKGLDNLICVWNSIYKDFPEWSLQIAGKVDDKCLNDLKNNSLYDKCERIKLLGFCSDIDSLYRSSKIFCLSSRTEGLPMGLLEAMNAGCCCVSFDCETGPAEIIENEKNGLLVENQNLVELEQCLRRVMTNDAECDRLAKNARQAVEKYSLERIITKWDDIFKDILCK